MLLVMTVTLTTAERWRLLMVTAGVGLTTLVLGAAQLSGGSDSALRFFDSESRWLNGFQANHNSTADVILIAMLAAAALARLALDRGLVQPRALLTAAIMVVADGALILGLFLTASRAGLGLLPLVLMLQYLILQPDARIRWGRLAVSTGGVAVLGGVAYALLRDNRAVTTVLSRFTFEGEFRPELWRDSLFALGRYWPAGSGQGTFTSVQLAVERLEVVNPTLPNRAHNDFLELAIGAGLPGSAALLAIIVIVALAAARGLRKSSALPRPQVLFGLGTLGVIALHSLVDYPMRSMALAALAATATGLLFPARQAGSGQSGEWRT
jgi:O-antigen ligase